VQIKMVWRVTGEGGLSIHAVGPDGATITPDWGPEVHSGSNWHRPGGGTGWTFPTRGCRRFEINRGSSIATLDVGVVSG